MATQRREHAVRALLNEQWLAAFPPKHLKASVAGGAAQSLLRSWIAHARPRPR